MSAIAKTYARLAAAVDCVRESRLSDAPALTDPPS